ncbi:DUF2202 domain-containing protein [Flavobacterium sp. HXWNR69]|uniref:DUF2202 domain-containing protein n=1 Tax=Flavobacterium fragile TaxID=2949085 RepID=A0ABT0THS6_9FLAO|nr:DUF2202 domain-containing protein [Flavobacterium sp. HXWNR69]MCL9770529.1 DUF2202 domain-containing protein [Flavobacterium sp. HXWNR69]
MKKVLFATVLTFVMFSSCSNDNDNQNSTPLTQAEIDDLKFLREEEKLARDVYLFSFNKYQVSIFDNISQSEQKHMNSILNLMNKYGIPDSASSEIGVFNNPDLQLLYNSLTAQSNISLVEALKVGATIEDLDINDIDEFIGNTTKSDLLNVYDNLTCGSKNHIRSYTSQLSSNNVTYEPQFISIEYYTAILSDSNGGCGNNQ